MIKLIISDLDGTLADEEGNIPKEVCEVIQELEEKEIHFAVATGRQVVTVENDFKEVLKHIYVIADNGAITKHNGEYLQVVHLDHHKAMEVAQTIKEIEDIEMIICCKEKAYKLTKDQAFEDEISKYYHSRGYLEDLEDMEEPIIKIAIYRAEGMTAELESFVRERWGDTFSVTVSGAHWLDIGHLHTSKGCAVQDLMAQLQLAPEACMAFGDYFNDASMLQAVGHPYVMEHAPEEMKQYAEKTVRRGEVLKVIREITLRD